jgi:phage baseplate assembly protein W
MFLYKHFIRENEPRERHAEAHEHDLFGQKPPELDEVERDVERNLRHILSTRRGYGYFVRDYGISDINLTAELVEKLKDEIQETVTLYEPRVEVLSINEHHDDDGAHVVLKIRVLEGKSRRKFVLDMATRTFLPGKLETAPLMKLVESRKRDTDPRPLDPGPFPDEPKTRKRGE